jgi:hypothetical protein
MTKDISNDTIFYGHVSALTNAALNHNASTIQLASEVIAAGPVYKREQMKRIRASFDKVHKDYQKEYQRIIDSLEKELES